MATSERFQTKDLTGIISPLTTPFIRTETDYTRTVVDVDSQDRLIGNLIDKGVHAIFLGSNAGEGRQMDVDNLKLSIVEGISSVERRKASVPVVVGVLRKDINEVMEVAKFAMDAGADALVYAPLYTDIDPEIGLERIIRETGIPVVIYNNPEFTDGENVPLKFVEYASQFENVIGIKDTSRLPPYFAELLTLRKPGAFHVYQGDTKTTYLSEELADIDGMVPVESNVFAEQLVGVWNSGNTSQLDEALGVIEAGKKKFGGTTKFIKHELVSLGIISTEQSFSL